MRPICLQPGHQHDYILYNPSHLKQEHPRTMGMLEKYNLQFVLIFGCFFKVNINTIDSDLNVSGQFKPAIRVRCGKWSGPRYISARIKVYSKYYGSPTTMNVLEKKLLCSHTFG